MRMSRRMHKKKSLRVAFRYLPFLILPFSVLFFETWLHMESLNNGYKYADIEREKRETIARIDELEDRIISLNALSLIDANAPNLGLVEPNPNQLEILIVDDLSSIPVDPHELIVASNKENPAETQTP